MRRYFVILCLLIPISGCAGCSFSTGNLGLSGSQSVTVDDDGAKPTNDNQFWGGQAMDVRTKR